MTENKKFKFIHHRYPKEIFEAELLETDKDIYKVSWTNHRSHEDGLAYYGKRFTDLCIEDGVWIVVQ